MFQFSPVCNFGKFIYFGLGTVRSVRLNMSLKTLTNIGHNINIYQVGLGVRLTFAFFFCMAIVTAATFWIFRQFCNVVQSLVSNIFVPVLAQFGILLPNLLSECVWYSSPLLRNQTPEIVWYSNIFGCLLV